MLKIFFAMIFFAAPPIFSESNSQPKLVLYMQPNCPYCQRVLSVIKSINIDVEMKDTNNPENKAYLVSKTNRATVPCLFIDGEPMFESKTIMEYLKGNK